MKPSDSYKSVISCQLSYAKGGGKIKKVVITIILFAISIALILGVILPIARHAKSTGNSAYQRGKQIGSSIADILQ